MTTDILRIVCRKASSFVERNAPTILTWLTGAGVIATAVSASEAGREAQLKEMEVLIKKNPDLMEDDCEIEPLSLGEKIRIDAPFYIPTAIIGGVTIFCAFKSNNINQERQRSLAAAYIFLREKYDDYIQKVKEKFGEETHQEILADIAYDQIQIAEPLSTMKSDFFGSHGLDVDLSGEPRRLFYDEVTGQYFESTLPQVLDAQNNLNRDMILGDFITVQKYCDYFGIKADNPPWETPLTEIGWAISDESYTLDFSTWEKTISASTEEGVQELQVIFISPMLEPQPYEFYY